MAKWYDCPTLTHYLAHVRSLNDSEDLVLSHLPLVVSVAKRYKHDTPDELLDLIQTGNVGLLNARATYTPDKGAFYKWASMHIRSTIRNYERGADCLNALTRTGDTKAGTVELDVERHRTQYKPEADPVLLLSSRLLTQKQRDVLRARLAGHTLQEIGDNMGTTHQAVRDLEQTAIERLSA